MLGLGWQELAIILVIVIIIFGAGKLPEIGSGLGKGIRGFKEESGMGDEHKSTTDSIEQGTSQTTTTLTGNRDETVRRTDSEARDRGVRADDI